MFNILINCYVCATMLLGGNVEARTAQQYLTYSNQAYAIVDGDYYNINNLNALNVILKDMLQESHTVPALSVSIHTETLDSTQKGVWLKLQYNGTQTVDDMPFDELLIEVNSSFQGFNVIRGNKGKYEGRCYYIDLISYSMEPLYQYILKTVDI